MQSDFAHDVTAVSRETDMGGGVGAAGTEAPAALGTNTGALTAWAVRVPVTGESDRGL